MSTQEKWDLVLYRLDELKADVSALREESSKAGKELSALKATATLGGALAGLVIGGIVSAVVALVTA